MQERCLLILKLLYNMYCVTSQNKCSSQASPTVCMTSKEKIQESYVSDNTTEERH